MVCVVFTIDCRFDLLHTKITATETNFNTAKLLSVICASVLLAISTASTVLAQINGLHQIALVILNSVYSIALLSMLIVIAIIGPKFIRQIKQACGKNSLYKRVS